MHKSARMFLTLFAGIAFGSALVLGSLTASAWAGGPWEITTIDASGDVGDHSSVAILPSGRPAISYFDQANLALKYAWSDVDGWHNATVDTAGHVGEHTSLAILPSGVSAISYHDVDQDDLKYAWLDGPEWEITIVDGDHGGYTGPTGTSLAVLPSGHAAISYRDHFNGWLKYAWYDGDTWTTTVVDDSANVGAHSSLAILPSGHPAIAYLDYSNDRLKYAWFDGSQWQTTIAAEPGGTNTCLAILPSGQPAIVHDATGGIRYVSFDGELWNGKQVDTVEGFESWFGYPGFAIQPSGDPAISYVRRQFPNAPQLIYAWLEDGDWQTTVIMVGGSAKSSLTFLPSGQPAISFRDANRLKYATRPGPSGVPGDLDGDGDVDAADLAQLLGSWGPCPEPCTAGDPNSTCLADLDLDCDVDAADLANLLGNWGP